MDLFDSKPLMPVYGLSQHQSGWWCIRDNIRDEILDGFYFKNEIKARKQVDALNKNFDEEAEEQV